MDSYAYMAPKHNLVSHHGIFRMQIFLINMLKSQESSEIIRKLSKLFMEQKASKTA